MPLAPDFFRVSDSQFLRPLRLSNLWRSSWKTPQNYLLTDSIAHGMIVGGSNDPFSLFEAASGLNESNIFRKDKGLRNSPCPLCHDICKSRYYGSSRSA